uniref:Uncharacterized protein n=1 Tax=Anguilla anguilla TaxID=7936 RepID=A0A0E9PIZ9_ANGAN
MQVEDSIKQPSLLFSEKHLLWAKVLKYLTV